MKRKLFAAGTVFAAFFIILTLLILHYGASEASGGFGSLSQSKSVAAEQIVAVNEIEQLVRSGKYEQAVAKTGELKSQLQQIKSTEQKDYRGLWICIIGLVFLTVIFGYVYVAILRPFDKLQQFAGEIAKGNFDLPLEYERSNYFGNFTWAFDSMRMEITKARSCEKEAIENNKTVIATLSHDIKTPIASIRAYAEGLEANMDRTPQKREQYLSVIMKKCDEVSKLTNDLFLHSLSDLDKLKIEKEEFELCGYLMETVSEIAAEQNDIRLRKPDFSVLVDVDKNRLTQIVENLINNARKYAKTVIDISVEREGENVRIYFRDYGAGIPDADMPFIYDKFYRGKNCGKEQGSGLGLYIVKYLLDKMGGSILLHSHEDGLEAIVSLPVKK